MDMAVGWNFNVTLKLVLTFSSDEEQVPWLGHSSACLAGT
jgi:hypothetical protein